MNLLFFETFISRQLKKWQHWTTVVCICGGRAWGQESWRPRNVATERRCVVNLVPCWYPRSRLRSTSYTVRTNAFGETFYLREWGLSPRRFTWPRPGWFHTNTHTQYKRLNWIILRALISIMPRLSPCIIKFLHATIQCKIPTFSNYSTRQSLFFFFSLYFLTI